MSIGSKLKKAAPVIFALLAGAGVVAIPFYTAKATKKTMDDISEQGKNYDDMSAKEIIVIGAPHFKDTIVLVFTTLGCVYISTALSSSRINYLTTALGIAGTKIAGLEKFKSKVYEEDPEIFDKVMHDIEYEECTPTSISTESFCHVATLIDGESDTPEVVRTFFDTKSGEYFESDFASVLSAEMMYNHNLQLDPSMTINNWRSLMGLREKPKFNVPCMSDEELDSIFECGGILWVNFENVLEVLPDGMEVWRIEWNC